VPFRGAHHSTTMSDCWVAIGKQHTAGSSAPAWRCEDVRQLLLGTPIYVVREREKSIRVLYWCMNLGSGVFASSHLHICNMISPPQQVLPLQTRLVNLQDRDSPSSRSSQPWSFRPRAGWDGGTYLVGSPDKWTHVDDEEVTLISRDPPALNVGRERPGVNGAKLGAGGGGRSRAAWELDNLILDCLILLLLVLPLRPQ